MLRRLEKHRYLELEQVIESKNCVDRRSESRDRLIPSHTHEHIQQAIQIEEKHIRGKL